MRWIGRARAQPPDSSTRFLGRVLLSSALTLALLGGCRENPPRMIEAGDELATVDAWLRAYDEITEHPRLPRAREIFQRMREVTGTHAELVMLDMAGARAFVLPDATVVLSRWGLDLCYDDVQPEEGDARLALLFGHELTHVASDDFWHASALDAIRDVDDKDDQLLRLKEVLAQDGRDRQVLELRADQSGFLALIEAGFDPEPLLAEEETFFDAWVGGAEGSIAYDDPDHPTVGDRARFVRGKLEEVVGRIELFERGVEAFREAEELAARGRGHEVLPEVEAKYREAADHFRRFGRYFEGREVLNNQALAHLRLATGILAACDGRLVNRYYLPTALDPVTLANAARLRGDGSYSSPCFEREDYQKHMKEAHRLLEEAVDRDPEYLPARLNLMAAYVLDESPASAVVEGLEAAKLDRDDPRAAAAPWVAHLAYHDLGGPTDLEVVLAELDALHRRFPHDPAIAFNLASALARRGRVEEAEPVWRAFLQVEPPESAWADVAREWLEEEPESPVVPAR